MGFAPPVQPQEDAPDEPATAPLQQWEVLEDVPQSGADEQHEQHAQEASTGDGPSSEGSLVQDELSSMPAAEHAADEQPPSSSGSPGGHEVSSSACSLWLCRCHRVQNLLKRFIKRRLLPYASTLSCDTGGAGDFYTDELAMESQQSAAEHAPAESEPTEQLDVARTPPKEKSTLAQVIMLLH